MLLFLEKITVPILMALILPKYLTAEMKRDTGSLVGTMYLNCGFRCCLNIVRLYLAWLISASALVWFFGPISQPKPLIILVFNKLLHYWWQDNSVVECLPKDRFNPLPSCCGGELFTNIQFLLLILASCYWGSLNRKQNA